MIDCGSLDYAQARLQARHGQRVDEAGWRRIETMREFAPLLELARGTALRPWLVGIAADSTAHAIEATCAATGARSSTRSSAWMPRPWQPALAWCAVLPDLAPLQHLARGGEPAAWMNDDGDLARAVRGAAAGSALAVLGAGPLAALAPAWAAPQASGGAGSAEWQRRLPQPLARVRATRWASSCRRWAIIAAPLSQAAPGQGWLLRAALRARLSLLLRRAALEPAAAFIHLALCALDLERLRGELLRRALFPRAGSWPDAAPAPGPLVRDPRRARRRDAGARGAGPHRRGRARSARQRRPARGR